MSSDTSTTSAEGFDKRWAIAVGMFTVLSVAARGLQIFYMWVLGRPRSFTKRDDLEYGVTSDGQFSGPYSRTDLIGFVTTAGRRFSVSLPSLFELLNRISSACLGLVTQLRRKWSQEKKHRRLMARHVARAEKMQGRQLAVLERILQQQKQQSLPIFRSASRTNRFERRLGLFAGTQVRSTALGSN